MVKVVFSSELLILLQKIFWNILSSNIAEKKTIHFCEHGEETIFGPLRLFRTIGSSKADISGATGKRRFPRINLL